MHLPSQLQHFSRPTLLIMSDWVMAKSYMLGGDAIEELDGISVPRERKTDAEGAFAASDGVRAGAPEDHGEEERLHRFTNELGEHLNSLARKHAIECIYLVMPAEIYHHIEERAPVEVKSKIKKHLDRDLMKTPVLEVIERILE